MKAITATFNDGEEVVAIAIAKFDALPGEGSIVWMGNTSRLLAALPEPFNERLTTIAYAGQFADAMRGLGARASLGVKITEEGEWEVFTE